jgi:hypothetical protein
MSSLLTLDHLQIIRTARATFGFVPCRHFCRCPIQSAAGFFCSPTSLFPRVFTLHSRGHADNVFQKQLDIVSYETAEVLSADKTTAPLMLYNLELRFTVKGLLSETALASFPLVLFLKFFDYSQIFK